MKIGKKEKILFNNIIFIINVELQFKICGMKIGKKAFVG